MKHSGNYFRTIIEHFDQKIKQALKENRLDNYLYSMDSKELALIKTAHDACIKSVSTLKYLDDSSKNQQLETSLNQIKVVFDNGYTPELAKDERFTAKDLVETINTSEEEEQLPIEDASPELQKKLISEDGEENED